jgi:HK97 family phage major capsid protein
MIISETTRPALETKVAPDLAFDEMQRAAGAHRQTQDEAYGELQLRGAADPLLEDRLARIDRELDEQKRRMDRYALARQRPALAGSEEEKSDPMLREHKAAFSRYIRSGEAAGLKTLEAKATSLSAGSGPDGGFLVPPPVERELLRRMSTISPIRALASVREISTSTFKKAYSTTGPGAGWVAETAARPQLSSQVLAEMNFPAMEIYAMPSATQTLLDDAAVDIEQWIAEEVDTVFAEQEATAFVNGDGVGKPTGFMTAPKSTQATWTWGKLGYVVSGAAGNFAAANASDALVDLIYALKPGYRQNATFVMTRRAQAAVRKLKATTGEYLWHPPAAIGQPATLMNFPVAEAEDMPEIAADSFSIALGDFRRGYLVVDRMGVRVLRDPYSVKPYVLFYTTKRVGGGIQDFDAIKLLKFGTT